VSAGRVSPPEPDGRAPATLAIDGIPAVRPSEADRNYVVPFRAGRELVCEH
jgi:hypothetical protein